MEGRVELELALDSGYEPLQVIFSESYTSLDELKSFLGDASAEFVSLSKALFDGLAYQHVPGNFMAVFHTFSHSVVDTDGLLVVLEGIEKPGNLGAILRTCNALGIEDVIVTESELDLFNPNVLRNSRGALFDVRCSFLTNAEAQRLLEEQGRTAYLAALADHASDYSTILDTGKKALVMGPESTGLSQAWLEKDNFQHLIIPMLGKVDSLNVSVSFAIMAAHLVKQ